jgi:rhodanese-related sulfurtransferase
MRSSLKIIPALLACALLLFSAAGAGAQMVRNLSTDELKERLDQPRRIVVVDTRTTREYRQGHISGAITITPEQFENLPALLPEDKNVPLVFYCRGYD